MSPSFRTRAAELTTRLLGAPPVGAAWRRLRPGLRILAYHGVPDSARFAEHLELIASTYAPVSGKQVMAARRGDAVLPDRALWVTFDDGDPSVVAHATDALTQRRIPATLFVCPGLIVNKRAPWWEIVLEAGRRSHGAAIDGRNLVGTSLVTALKSVPDFQRRDICAEIEQAAGPLPIEALSLDELGRWQQAGLEIGNHTWDHPCLDRCTPEEQTQQIRRAHDWLDEHFQPEVPLFAYPNGDQTDHAEGVLRTLGYDGGLLFDHRVNSPAQALDPSRELSRLRIDASGALPRTRAIISGVHADLFAALGG